MVSGRLPRFSNSSTTPKPSTSGIWISRNTRSGCSRWIRAMAVLPSPHSATISMSGSAYSRPRRRSRASASSSLSKTRMDIGVGDLLVAGSIRNADFHGASAARRVFQHHGVIFVVELLQAAAGIAQAHAFGRHDSTAAVEASAVVAYLHPHIVAIAPGGNANQSRRAARSDSMADGVLHQRLQEQVGDERVEGAGIDVALNPQSVAEANLLNVDVLLQEREFLLQ